MLMARILVVENDEGILELVSYHLLREGHEVVCVHRGEEALNFISQQKPDLILLDLMLPDFDGLDVFRKLRSDPETSDIPLILLTAKRENSDIVTGLELDSNDHVTKPLSPRILLERIRAVLRRRQEPETREFSIVTVHEIEIYPGRHEVLVRGRLVPLTATEFRLLHVLAHRPGWVFSRDQIINAVRGGDYPVTDRSVDVQIVGLRKKLGEAGSFIETVRGVGYRFKE